jgi:23S rRNA pseudouridine2605 synthase
MKKELKSKAKSPPAKRAQKSAPGNTAGSTKAAEKSKAVGTSKGAVAKAKAARVKATAPTAKTKAAKVKPAEKRGAKAEKASAAATKARKTKTKGAAGYKIGEPVLDPIGDVSSGEARTYLGEVETPGQAEMEAYRAETETAALVGTLEAEEEMTAASEAASEAGAAVGVEEEEAGAAQPPAKLERLQKILSQAGIASRRHAEEMVVAGRVMVNGQVVTQLGSKADPKRDHIRVDGKLLQGAERHRYFVLNKPRGFVTTVSDPEGRPTVMQFFAKMHERLYPVGRLDYQSEGLLLMTNDGELANLLTKAGSGVEKIYLVKVAGQPSEEEMEQLRGGVAIERGEVGSERVRTAPARIRQVRVGENPWYEVVLTEGRNRELRKMFAGVGHFAEKIRRVGYGPLALDVEPGKLRELTADEVNALRLTAEGKMKPRRVKVDRVLPKEAGRGSEKRGERPAQSWRNRPTGKRFDAARERAPGRGGKPFRQQEERGQRRDFRPRDGEFRGRREGGAFRGGGPRGGEKPGFGRRQDKPFGAARPRFDKPGFEKRSFDRPQFEKPAGEPVAGKAGGFAERPKFEGRKPFTGGKRPFGGGRPSSGPKRGFDRPRFDKPGFEKRSFDRPRFEKPGFNGKPGGQTEGRREGAPRKPFRPQGDRPNFKPGGAGRAKPGFGKRPGGFGKPNRPGGFKRPNKPGSAGRGGSRIGRRRPDGR